MAKDWLADLLENEELLVQIFNNTDITAKASKISTKDFSKEQKEIYAKAKKFFNGYWNKDLQNAKIVKTPNSFSNDYPANFIGNADADAIAKFVAYIYGNEEKLEIAGDLGEEMYGERFKKDLSDYAKSKDNLTEQESEKQLNLFSDSLNLDLISAMVSGQRIGELTEAVNENLAHEDFNEMKNPNFREEDFLRQWNHSDTKHPTYPDDIANKMLHLRTPKTDEVAIANISVKEFLSKLDDTDRKILDLLQKGYTQKEIANELGFESNSAVSKRITKLRLTRVKPVTPDK